MSADSGIRRRVVRLLAGFVGRSMLKNGEVRRAPKYALLQVTESQTTAFGAQIASIARQFDHVLALWPNDAPPRNTPGNVELFPTSNELTSRWQLVSRCGSGFVFPLSISKPIQNDHASTLQKLLFQTGGASGVGLVNLQELFDESSARNTLEGRLLLAPHLDPDFAIFDQRFWRLADGAITEDEAEAFAQEARARGFALFACDHPLSAAFNRQSKIEFEPEVFIEQFIRYPVAVKSLNQTSAKVTHEMFHQTKISSSEELRSLDRQEVSLDEASVDEQLIAELRQSFRKHNPEAHRADEVLGTLLGSNYSEVAA